MPRSTAPASGGVASALMRARIPLLLLVAVSLLPALKALEGLSTNNTIDSFLAEDDPALMGYREHTERFGGDHVVYVALKVAPDSLFTPQQLGRIDATTKALAAVPGVLEVTSLTATEAVISRDGGVSVGDLVKRPPTTQAEASRLQEEVLGSPLLRRLVASDQQASLAVVQLDGESLRDPAAQNRIVAQIRTRLRELDTSRGGSAAGFAMAGNPVVAEAIERYNTRDQQVFAGLMLLLVAVSSMLLLRSVVGGLMPLLVVGVTVTWTMGLFVAAGQQTNWVTSILTPILLLVGVADTVHYLSHYQERVRAGLARREAVVASIRAVALPCLFTTLTTAVGFASLAANQVAPVRVFGVFAALGVLLALAASLIVVPCLLALKDRPGQPMAPEAAERRGDRWLAALDGWVQRRAGLVLVGSLVAARGVAAGASALRVETNLLKYFKEDAPVVQDSLLIEQAFGGSSPLDIVVDTGEPDGALQPEVLLALARLQARLRNTTSVAPGVSLPDLLAELHRAMAREPSALRVPDDEFLIEQLLLLVDDDTLEPMVDEDRQILRLATRFEGARLGLGGARHLLATVKADCATLLPPSVKVRLTGSSVLFINMDTYLVSGQIRSFGLVLLVLTVMMILLQRSVRMGLCAMIPNVLPMVTLVGLMGWLGIPIDGFTVMIASVAIGIGVDDTIHYLHHLRRELAAGHPLSEATRRTAVAVGRPVVATSVVLALGFWVFCLSDFVGTRNFGLLTGITVLVALYGDLLVFPAALKVLGVPRGWGRAKQ